ncbi:hypothetical protein EZV73_02025 [Acidaminobacter sp. JC074]|uniref:amidohydrolase family protein n=1 Tax=Acidaminobacter sp. JC074 TaxID=2530199 RepID=UPI001F0D0586|nr:hypothetical protein [Acidaminobacter sp. JC074]
MDTDIDARKAVLYTKEAGFDFVKVYNHITPLVYQTMVDEAKLQNILLIGHLPDCANKDYQNGDELCEIRQETIEHISFLTDLNFDRFVNANIHLDPTLNVEHTFFRNGLNDNDFKEILSRINPITIEKWTKSKEEHMAMYKNKPKEKAAIRNGFDYYRKMITMFKERDGKFLAGTDSGIDFLIPGYSLHKELEHLVECGLTPYEALKAATSEPAQFLSNKKSGTVEIGKHADLVILNSNPLINIMHTQDIFAVINQRTFFDKTSISELINSQYNKTLEELEYL